MRRERKGHHLHMLIEPSLRDEADEAAAAENLSLSAWIRNLIREALKRRKEPKHD